MQMTQKERWAPKAWPLLGDTQCGDLSWVCIVLSIKGRVHCQFASEHQLPLPPVPWNGEVEDRDHSTEGATGMEAVFGLWFLV